MSEAPHKFPFLLAGRLVAAAAGLQMFALSVYWQMTFIPVAPDATDAAWHPFFVAIAVIGLVIVFAGVGRRPTRLLGVMPVAAPLGLYCLLGEGPVKWMGYGFLVAIGGTALVYQGCKDLKARHVVRDVV